MDGGCDQLIKKLNNSTDQAVLDRNFVNYLVTFFFIC